MLQRPPPFRLVSPRCCFLINPCFCNPRNDGGVDPSSSDSTQNATLHIAQPEFQARPSCPRRYTCPTHRKLHRPTQRADQQAAQPKQRLTASQPLPNQSTQYLASSSPTHPRRRTLTLTRTVRAATVRRGRSRSTDALRPARPNSARPDHGSDRSRRSWCSCSDDPT